MGLGGFEGSILRGRTPSEAVKGSGGFHPEPCERSPVFSFGIRPRARKYLGWVGSTFCELSAVTCQAKGKPIYVSDDGGKPGAGERVRTNLKIVPTNRISHLGSTSLSQTRSKESGAGERVRKNHKIVPTNRISHLESTSLSQTRSKKSGAGERLRKDVKFTGTK